MFDKAKEILKFRKMQSEMKKELENIFATVEKSGVRIVIRGNKHIEKITVDEEEQRLLKDMLNDSMKEVDKKVEKQMRGKLGDFGIPGL